MHIQKLRRAAVTMENVSYRRHAEEPSILTDITLSIQAGEWVALAGRNGAGKSTLARLINGLLPHTEGSIIVEGMPLQSDTIMDIRKRVGIVFANPDNQFVGLTVADDLAFGLENLCLDEKRMHDRLRYYAELLEIEPLLNRHPSYLSGGQKQRAAIAAVLAMEPSIVIFDEAASMLDEHAKHDLLGIMQRMRASGEYTIISVTHDTEEMAAADRLIMLDEGAIAADGMPEELLKNTELLKRCRIEVPYVLQVCKELEKQGISIGEHLTEKELLDALWAYNSRTSHIATRAGSC